MILIDTSAWIELFAGRAELAADRFPGVATCGPVIQEVFQGLRPGQRARRIRWQMLSLHRLGDPLTLDLFVDAADLYALCRRRGKTIRSSTDCLIAAIAIRHDVPVWHQDRDFAAIAACSPLEIWTPPRGRVLQSPPRPG